MSKSKGEFLTLSLLESKGYDPMAYRFFCMQSHYRKSLVFSYENLDNAAAAYEKLVQRIAALKQDGAEIDSEAFDACKKVFVEAMDNDLNTSMAVTALYDVLKAKTNDATKLALIADFDRVLCLNLLKAAEEIRTAEPEAPAGDAELIAEIERLIVERAEAKKAKNYARADEIRAYLSAKGVTLLDTKDGTQYKIG
jgi:cysteinyl-tRNA synthetase